MESVDVLAAIEIYATRAVVSGVAGGIAAEIQGGGFWDGFWAAAGSSVAQSIYEFTLNNAPPECVDCSGFKGTWASGGDAISKGPGTACNAGICSVYDNNIGFSGDAKWSLIKFGKEGSAFMNGVNRVPGMNAMAAMHDIWMSGGMNKILQGIIIVPSIIPAMAITYANLIGPSASVTMTVGLDAYPRH
jgi:hypothetical protein